jgi:hypothetical protein
MHRNESTESTEGYNTEDTEMKIQKTPNPAAQYAESKDRKDKDMSIRTASAVSFSLVRSKSNIFSVFCVLLISEFSEKGV